MSKQLIVLLSRQRSGTNAFRAVIDSHVDLHCYEEVLNPDEHYLKHDWSYFNFIRANCSVADLHPGNQLNIFSAFIDHLHNLHRKPKTLIDLKYNTCSHISANWRPMTGGAAMPVFNWIRKNGLPVIRLRRNNYLRVALSNEIANQRQKWHDRPGEKTSDTRVVLQMDGRQGWLQQMLAWELEDQLISEYFDGYGQLLELEYSEIFPRMNQPIRPDALEQTAKLLDITNDFSTETWCAKSTSRPLWESIINWPQVVAALKDSRFESLLEDEPMYRGISEVVSESSKIKLETASTLLRRLAA
jgi:hypothetical protein